MTPESRATLPPRHRQVSAVGLAGDARGVAREGVADAVALAVRSAGTLHDWAGLQPDRRALHGRGVAWAVRLADGTPVVVRRNRHGGLLARFTGDRFLPPTRAPRELATAVRLAAAGVPTPELVAYMVYPAGPLLRRVDVVTREVAESADLPAALDRWPGHRTALLAATARLVSQLTRAGARHADLNVKNILLTMDGETALAHVLDVDRVVFGGADDPAVLRANLARLVRSVQRWHERRGPLLDEGELQLLERLAREDA